MQWFVKELRGLADFVDGIYSNIVPMEILSDKQYNTFYHVLNCHICGKPFLEADTKVRDRSLPFDGQVQ